MPSTLIREHHLPIRIQTRDSKIYRAAMTYLQDKTLLMPAPLAPIHLSY